MSKDIATGTGRFASFVLDNFRGLDATVLDLSPFYLAKAKTLLERFPGVTYVEVQYVVNLYLIYSHRYALN